MMQKLASRSYSFGFKSLSRKSNLFEQKIHAFSTKVPSSILYSSSDDALHFCFSSGDDKSTQPFVLNREKSEFLADMTDENVILPVADCIESHYAIENSNQFVGGMGENDNGVWFSSNSDSCDVLDYSDILKEIIYTVKQNRHGIPFGAYSSGIVNDPDIASKLKSDIGLSTIQVSLLSSTPDGYASIRQISDLSQAQRDFGSVCNFIAIASENGFPVTAAVGGGKHTGGASELAKALGAVDIVIYDNVGI